MYTATTSSFVGARVASRTQKAGPRNSFHVSATGSIGKKSVEAPGGADFFPGAIGPAYLDGSMAGDFSFDPLGLGADPVALAYYRQAELQHCRWAMLGVAGILGAEIAKPDIFWYDAALPENLPDFVSGDFNLASLLAVQFFLMHWVEVRRWQDIREFGSVNQDPIFTQFAVPNETMGYPGGAFDPFGFSKGDDLFTLQTKEIKNGRLAMIAFVGFTIQAQALGKGPIACLKEHVASPTTTTVGHVWECVIPESADVSGVIIPTPCLWPGI
jgi:light-harvesting complex I chlorophyll a/b binding protein 4